MERSTVHERLAGCWGGDVEEGRGRGGEYSSAVAGRVGMPLEWVVGDVDGRMVWGWWV